MSSAGAWIDGRGRLAAQQVVQRTAATRRGTAERDDRKTLERRVAAAELARERPGRSDIRHWHDPRRGAAAGAQQARRIWIDRREPGRVQGVQRARRQRIFVLAIAAQDPEGVLQRVAERLARSGRGRASAGNARRDRRREERRHDRHRGRGREDLHPTPAQHAHPARDCRGRRSAGRHGRLHRLGYSAACR